MCVSVDRRAVFKLCTLMLQTTELPNTLRGLRRCVQKLNMNTFFERFPGIICLRNVGAQTADRQCA